MLHVLFERKIMTRGLIQEYHSRACRFLSRIANNPGNDMDPLPFRRQSLADEGRALASALTCLPRFIVRCWLAVCFMRRLKYSRHLAWVKAER